MEPIRVHIAELVIAADPATADLSIADTISERAKASNVVVIAREIVADDETAIRAQLEAWIAQPDVDVVIATGPRESTAASSALRPLVTQPVPGFTDLFRWLAFQEIGASAMHSNAEAAQCLSTFVFVLPASPQAVRDAMDKLILPQLDPKTKPKNLVTQIPRLAPLVAAIDSVAVPEPVEGAKTEAVPTQIGPEKTEGGPGIPARMPARRSPTAKNAVRKEPPPDVTKQIDREQLERQIRSSTQNDSPTRPNIDLRKFGLPRVPPGADEGADEGAGEVGDDTDLTTPVPPAPLARVKLQPRNRPPSVQIPPLPGKRQTPPAGMEATPRHDTDRDKTPIPDIKPVAAAPTRPSQPAPIANAQVGAAAAARAAAVADDAATPPSGTKVPAVISFDALAKAAAGDSDNAPTKIKSIDDVNAEREARKRESRKALEEMPDATRKGIGAVGESSKPTEQVATEPSTAYVTSTLQTDEAPPALTGAALDRALAMPRERLSTSELSAEDLRDAIVEEGPTKKLPVLEKQPRTRPPTSPPLPPKRRAPTEPPPTPGSRTKPGPAQPPPLASDAPRAKRTPTEPPPPRAADDLPRGKFSYPVKKSGAAKTVIFLLLSVIFACGGIAFVKFFILRPEKKPEVATNPPPPIVADAAIAIVEPDAAVVAEAQPDAPEIEIEAPPPDAAMATPHPNHHHPVVAHAPKDAGVSAPAADAAQVAAAGSNVDPSCDEVSCVLEKYARPCCARFKPSDGGFKPKTGGLPDELDKAMVKNGVERVKPRVISCGEKISAKGTVRVSLTVGPDGVVKDASVVESPAPELGNCVATALRAAHFDKSAKGGSFTYPFVF